VAADACKSRAASANRPSVDGGRPQPTICKCESRFAFAALCDHAQLDFTPTRGPFYQRLLAEGVIDSTVSGPAIKEQLRKLKQAADEERILNLVPVAGKFRTVVIDAPWATALSRGGRACPYATMSQQQLLDLPIPKWLEDDAHVYLWTLDSELRNALALFDHWGIAFKQMLAWNKTYPSGIPRMGLGYHFRSNVEYILFGVRGNLRTREAVRAIGKAFEAPVVGEHSEKPDRFYEIVRAASYPPFGEVFGRKPRDGFTNLYQEATQDVTKAAA
jgi:N6-adenosine-specific RNA methylase IME4